jgi:phosphoglycerate kinase
MKIKGLKDIKELKGKKVLLRVDFNVPTDDKGKIQDDSRITASLPTINFLRENAAKIIIMSHLGRPDGKVVEKLRLDKVANHLSELLGTKVKKINQTIGTEAEMAVSKMENSDILVLENTRFNPGEESADEHFTKALANLGDIYVSDAFGTAHRRHASTAALAEHMPAYAGLLMEKEINALSPIVNGEYEKPLTMIFGGSKIDTKIGMIKNFVKKADYFLIGGGLANTFLAAAGYNVADSLYEKDKLEIAREIMLECEVNEDHFILPHDVVVADEISDTAKSLNLPVQDVMGAVKILDVGQHSTERFKEIIAKSKTVIWNGPLGLYEIEAFAQASEEVAQEIAKRNCVSIIGGGDTLDCINKSSADTSKFTHISTGGGAAIEFLSGDKLPGIEIFRTEAAEL